MEFRILGPLEVTKDGLPLPLGPPKQRMLVLTGLGDTSSSGDVPEDNDPCTVGANSGTVVPGSQQLVDSSGAQLIMFWNATSTVIPFMTPSA